MVPRMSLSDALGRRNSLNALRLVLALLVIVSHAWPLSGRTEPLIGSTSIGTLAVYGFFAISGYLITRSRHVHSSGGRYLWHRFLRIYPAYWVCLVVTAAVFAPVAFAHEHHGLSGFSPADSAKYVVANITISLQRVGIRGTLTSVPLPQAWDGSLWTLVYEMSAYLAVFVLAAVGLLRRSVTALVFAALTVTAIVVPIHDLAQIGMLNAVSMQFVIPFGLAFAAGALLYMFADHIPVRWWLAVPAAVIVAVGLEWLDQPCWLISVPLAYLVMWFGVRLPLTGISNRRDISYGTYIYAFPVQQLLADYGVARDSLWLFIAATVALTFILAALSRVCVEGPADRLKRWTPTLSWARRPRLDADPSAFGR